MNIALKTAAIILSAGFSKRMGSFKSLLPIGGKAALSYVIHTLKKAGISNIVVVTGFEREKLSHIIEEEGVIEAYNESFAEGMFSSIQTGLRAAKNSFPDFEGIFLSPVDCPLISPRVYEMLYEKSRSFGSEYMSVACYMGKKGHPLFIPSLYINEIIQGSGSLKTITDKYDDKLIRADAGNEAVLLDMDTPSAYEKLVQFYKNGCKSPDALSLSLGRRIYLVRHGEIIRHSGKIFLGQYDPPLSDEGRLQASLAADKLLDFGARPRVLYTSDLLRADETAGIIAQKLNVNCEHIPGLREMSLGSWDGRLIDEIKAEYPDKYLRRGQDLLKFKLDHHSESYYDLLYRTHNALCSILERDKSQDIVAITHSGVIHVLKSLFEGKELAPPDKKTSVPRGGVIRLH